MLSDLSTHAEFYINDFIQTDFQEIVFESELQKSLIYLISQLMRCGNAPTRPAHKEIAEITKNKKLLKLEGKKSRVFFFKKKRGDGH